ncbi:cobyric acid synthase CobQ, partial [Burkholderia pseudomallei]|nr:cobyric acid synthase CobQ [Burkholderia pseudomallei]
MRPSPFAARRASRHSFTMIANANAHRPRGTLKIQGTTSDAGKSTLDQGLCQLA